MSSDVCRYRWSSDKSRRLDDVSLAWDSLHQAKEVFQTVENRIGAVDRLRARAQKIRRRLQMDWSEATENVINRNTSAAEDTVDPTPEMKLGGTPGSDVVDPGHGMKGDSPAGRDDEGSTLLSSTKVGHSCKKPSEMGLWDKTQSRSFDSEELSTTQTKENSMAAREGLARSHGLSCLCSPPAQGKWDSSMEDIPAKANKPAEDFEEALVSTLGDHQTFAICSGVWEGSPPSRSPSPHIFPLGTPYGPYVQKLEYLKSKSPERKLEKLKDRIREQRRRSGGLPVAQHGSAHWALKEAVNTRSLRRTVRKVTFGPPPPVYRGFSSVNSTLGTFLPEEVITKPEAESLRTPGQENIAYEETKPPKRDKDAKQSLAKRKHRSYVPQKSSSKSSMDERKEKDSVSKLYGASAWREGQKLVRKLLGPLPVHLKPALKPQLETGATDNTTDDPAAVKTESSASNRQNRKPGTNLKDIPALLEKTALPTDSKMAKDTRQVLAALHSQNKPCMQRRSPVSPPSIYKNLERSQEEQGRFKDSILESEIINLKRNTNKRAISTSPRRSRTASVSPEGKDVDKENLQCTESLPNTSKVRSYSVEEVREYMNRKVAERQRKELEAKREKKKAIEQKKKRMEDLFKKQKDALPKRENSREEHGPKKRSKEMPGHKIEQLNGGSALKNTEHPISEWVQLTSQALLKSEESGSSDFNGKTTRKEAPQQAKAGLGIPSRLPSETHLSSPLKLKDLNLPEPSPPKNLTFRMNLKRTDGKSLSPDGRSQNSLYRSKEDRILAIHAVAKKLEEKIQMEAGRLRLLGDRQHSSDAALTGPDLGTLPNSVQAPDKFQNELSRMLSITSPLLLLSAESLKVSSNHVQEKSGQASPVAPGGGSDRSNVKNQDAKSPTVVTPLTSPTTASEELPWSSGPEAKEDGGEKQETRAVLQNHPREDFTGLRIPENRHPSGDRQKRETTPVPSPESLTSGRSPRRQAESHGDCGGSLTSSPHVRNSGGLCLSHPEEPPGEFATQDTPLFPGSQSTAVACGRTRSTGEEETNFRHPRESPVGHRIRLGGKRQAQELKEETELEILKQKLELETQEARRSLDELRKKRLKREYSKTESAIRHLAEDGSKKGMAQKCEGSPKHTIHVQDGITEQRKASAFIAEKASRASFTLQGSINQVPQDSTNAGPQNCTGSERCVMEDSGESSEPATDSTSKWSEICQYYGGPPMFSRFTLEMAQQCLRDEELRARHQTALLRLREEALKEKTKAELAWLEHQRTRFERRGDYEKVPEIVRKQQDILTQLQQEQTEISHLQNIHRAAHLERKLLLRHQKELLQLQQSTAQLHARLQALAGSTQVSVEQGVTAWNEKAFGPWTTPELPAGEIQFDFTPVFEIEKVHADRRRHREDGSHPAQKEARSPNHRLGTERLNERRQKVKSPRSQFRSTDAEMPDEPADQITNQTIEEATGEDQEMQEEPPTLVDIAETPKPLHEEILNRVPVLQEENKQRHTGSVIMGKESVPGTAFEVEENSSVGVSPVYWRFTELETQDPVAAVQEIPEEHRVLVDMEETLKPAALDEKILQIPEEEHKQQRTDSSLQLKESVPGSASEAEENLSKGANPGYRRFTGLKTQDPVALGQGGPVEQSHTPLKEDQIPMMEAVQGHPSKLHGFSVQLAGPYKHLKASIIGHCYG
ncbi:coiled-coil domain-containing protein 187 [Ambystoma mexicanum]|uniref:coiled-coil domain-containing protein 187 n=1 Tax=Ambystoma mexicanum TaxID=8296 RepID=UPI0037E75EED